MSLQSRISELITAIGGDIKDINDTIATQVSSSTISSIVQLTQAAYDALSPPASDTLYIIVG